MARPETLLISAIVLNKDKSELVKQNFSPDNMVIFQEELRYIMSRKGVPSKELFLSKFPDFNLTKRVDREEIDELIEQCKLRKIKRDTTTIIRKATIDLKNKNNPVKVAKDIESNFRKVNNQYMSYKNIDTFDDMDNFKDMYKQKRSIVKAGKSIGISYGINNLDKITGGMQDNELISIVARTGIGKTFLMCKFVASGLLEGKNMLFCSLEMSPNAIKSRIFTILSYDIQKKNAINYDNVLSNHKMNMGKIPEKKLSRILGEIQDRVKGKLYVPEIKGNFSIEDAGRQIEELNPDVAFFDYFGLQKGEGSGRIDNWVQASEASHTAKKIAMDNDIPFILGAQLNRAGSQSPKIENIALTDSISQDSDKIFILSSRANATKLIVDCQKFRGGMSGWKVTTNWNVDLGEIKELSFDDGRL